MSSPCHLSVKMADIFKTFGCNSCKWHVCVSCKWHAFVSIETSELRAARTPRKNT